MFTISYFIRKYKSECRLAALYAADGNPNIMSGSNLLCNRKAEPRSVFVLLRPRLIKAFENPRQILPFDAGTGIRDGNRIALQSNPDGVRRLIRKFYCVVNNDQEHLTNPVIVPLHQIKRGIILKINGKSFLLSDFMSASYGIADAVI